MPSDLPQFTKLPMYLNWLDSGLQRRVETLNRGVGANAHVMLLLADGYARIDGRHGEASISGPAIVWRHTAGDFRLTLEAGSMGYLAEIAEETLVRAIGDFFESSALHTLLDKDWTRSLADDQASYRILRQRLDSILDELKAPQAGTGMMIVAHLRIILVTIMRASGIDEIATITHGNSAHYLQRFRQLLEGGFRAQHPVGYYANELGITHDRLHAICVRELNKNPKALIAERVAREAALGLERSTLSIKQLSYTLGFRDPAHFSNFFRRMTGLTPGRFRKLTVSANPETDGFSPPSFADWP
jgi:AraC family transcriptional regulator, transcriptional activator of pobA